MKSPLHASVGTLISANHSLIINQLKNQLNMPNLNECKLITAGEYLGLNSPEFIGQTRADNNGTYYMVWKENGILYKTCNQL
jgi:hypothetical protein